MDGLRAPLILHNKNETYQYDEEVIVTVSGNISIYIRNYITE